MHAPHDPLEPKTVDIPRVEFDPPSRYPYGIEVVDFSELRRRVLGRLLHRASRVEFFLLIGSQGCSCRHEVDFRVQALSPGDWLVVAPGRVLRLDATPQWDDVLVVSRPARWHLATDPAEPDADRSLLLNGGKCAQEGGKDRQRGEGKTKPGPLAPLMVLRLVDLTLAAVAAWAVKEAKDRPARVRLALRLQGLNDLKDRTARAKIRARLERVKAGNFGDCKPLRDGVQELRVDHGPGYRVFLSRHGPALVLLPCGSDKGDQDRAIRQAVEYLADWKQRGSP